MQKLALLQVIYNNIKFIPQVYKSVFDQSYRNFDFYAVIAGNKDGSKEYIAQNFPQVKIIDPGYNIGFSKGHNLLFNKVDAELFQLINPDLILSRDYLEKMIRVFDDSKVAAATGKIFQYDFENSKPKKTIDTTGVVISKSGRARDRGQHQLDSGQFDNSLNVAAVSGASAMYRKSALESVKYKISSSDFEYFDEDFHTYWEDVDLSWRLINAGWKIRYNPNAVAYHGRAAASSPGGYKKVFAFVKHHKKIAPQILQNNYKNHIFMFIKNSPRWYWQFFAREFIYHIYVLIFETSTFKILPRFFTQLPKIWRKRKFIKQNRKISVQEMEEILV